MGNVGQRTRKFRLSEEFAKRSQKRKAFFRRKANVARTHRTFPQKSHFIIFLFIFNCSRVAFDEDRVPDLHGDQAVLSDIHSVSSLLKMYFRELPNPVCTYHLYER